MYFFPRRLGRLEEAALGAGTEEQAERRGGGLSKASGVERGPSRLVLCAGVAIVYYAVALISLRFALVGSVVTPVWPASGIALVALLRYGSRVWPGITLAALAVNLPIAGGPLAAAAIATGNTLAPLLAWRVLEWTEFDPRLERLRDSAVMVATGVACMTVSAAIGTSALAFSGIIETGRMPETFAVWWAGDASGVLIYAAALLVFGKPLPETPRGARRALEALALLITLGLVSPFAFFTTTHPSRYLVFPFLVWAAVRFGQIGAVLSTVLVTGVAIAAATGAEGPFAGGSLLTRMISLQTFNVSVATTAFILASAMEERRRALSLVSRSAVELEAAVRERSAELLAANRQLSHQIAERDLTQRLLRESEERFRTLFEAAPIGLAQASPGGELVTANSSFLTLVGYTGSELKRMRLDSLAHPQDAARCRSMFEALVSASSGPRELELRFRRKDGTEFWGLLSVAPVRHETGETRFVHASLQDLSERRRVELLDQAEAERHRLYEMFLRVPAAVFVARGPEHVVEFANPNFVELLGDPSCIGKPVPSTLFGADTGALLESVYSSGEPVSLTEHTVTAHGGAERFFNCLLQPMWQPMGEIEGVTGHMTDVTDLIRARNELEAVAAERASVYLHEHEIAETLQRSLLPDRLPELKGLTLAARYLPGSAGIDVGGDWYDIFPMAIGRVGLVVGDVIGRGLKAAAAMGQLRIALRAYALDADDPAAVLARLSGLLEDLSDVEMATVFFGIVDYGHQSFRFASAGHPAPLLLKPNGEAVFLEGGRRPPLGVPMKGERSARADLEPGCTLILYSDGLVERRDQSIDEGMEQLRRLVSESNRDLESLCNRIIEILAGNPTDDVALLALRTATTPEEGLTLTVPAEPKALTAARRALRQWFGQVGARDQEADDLVLAINEAIANAIDHAYGLRTGAVLVEAELAGGEVIVTISDQGRWEEPARQTGRGFELMGSLVDQVEVERSKSGTRVRMVRRLGDTSPRVPRPLKFSDRLGRPAERADDDGYVPVVKIEQDLDLSNAAGVDRDLEAAIARTSRGLIVDVSAVGFLDSAGLRVLFGVAEELERRAQKLAVVAPEGSSVRETLDLVCFQAVATVASDLTSAQAAFRPRGSD